MAADKADSGKSSDKSPPGGPKDWRGRKHKRQARPAWQGGDEKSLSRRLENRRFRHRTRRFVLSALLLALVGVLVWTLIDFHAATPFIAEAFIDYDAPLPPNAWAQDDVNWFEAAAQGTKGNLKWCEPPRQGSSGNDEWLDALEHRVKAAVKDQTNWLKMGALNVVLVYVSAHGVVDPDRRACLVLPWANERGPEAAPLHLDPKRWLRVSELVKRLGDVEPRYRKVLLLDASRIPSHWGMGMLYNDFVEQLPSALGEADNEPVVIINSTSPGETGWTSQTLGGSVFARCVLLGLRGAAARPGADKLTVGDLVDYLKVRVDGWSVLHRHCPQQPLLLPDTKETREIDLAWANPRNSADDWNDLGSAGENRTNTNDRVVDELARELKKYHEEDLPRQWVAAQEQWQLLAERARRAGAGGEGPGEFLDAEELRQLLLRWEQLAVAGPTYLQKAIGEWDDLAARIRTLHEPREPACAYSLWRACPWRRAEGRNAPATDGTTVDDKPTSRDDKPLPFAASKAMFDVWDGLLKSSQADFWRTIHAKLETLPPINAPEPIEIGWLRLLAADVSVPEKLRVGDAIVKALLQRDLAEQAAWPADDREHYAVQVLVDTADVIRRKGDDRLFLGHGPAAMERYEESEKVYTLARDLGEKVRSAFRLRDRAYMELPHLAYWLDGRFRLEPASNSAGDRRKRLMDAINDLHDLAAMLDEFVLSDKLKEFIAEALTPRDDPETVPLIGFHECAQRLEENLGRLESDHQQLSAKETGAAELLGVLSIQPFVGADRIGLWTKLVDIDESDDRLGEQLTPEERANLGKQEPASSARLAGESGARRLSPVWAWKVHPAYALLAPETLEKERQAAPPTGDRRRANDPSAEEIDKARLALRRAGEQVLKVMTNLRKPPHPTKVDQSQAALETALSAPEQIGEARKILSEDEARRRRAAAFLAGDARAFKTLKLPLERLGRFDACHFLAWQARRAVGDFWGRLARRDDSEAPYYRQLAERLLEEIEKQAPLLATASRDRIVQELARAEGFKMTLSADPDGEDKAYVDVQLKCTFGPGGEEGEAALFVVDVDGKPVETANNQDFIENLRTPVTVNAVGDGATSAAPTPDFAVRARFTRGTDPKHWSLVGFYRGHAERRAFGEVGPGTPYRVVKYERANDRTVTVKVTHDRPEPASVVFLVDCSGSMYIELPGRRKGSRMQAAQAAVKSALETLGKQRQVRVGLWLFGARFRNDKDGVNLTVVPNGWAQPDSSGNDVFPAVELTPLDEPGLAVKAITKAVDKAAHYGETPLYYAIAEAIKNGFPKEVEGEDILVVISDGMNQVVPRDKFLAAQYAANPKVPSVMMGTGKDVLMIDRAKAALNDRPRLRMFVVNCGGKRALDDLESLVFKQLAPRDQDAVPRPIDVTNREELSDRLAEAAGAYKYQIWNFPTGNTQISETHWVGDELELTLDRDDSRRRYEVRVPLSWTDDTTIPPRRFVVEGGERVTWNLHRPKLAYQGLAEWTLGAKEGAQQTEIDNHVPEGAKPDDDLNPPQFRVAAVWRDSSGVRDPIFEIAIQNNDETRFSPRPAEAWIEIRPVASDGGVAKAADAAPYIFYDLAYDTKRPGAPVLVCEASGWPEDATGAEVRVWWTLVDRPGDGAPTAIKQPVRDALTQNAGKLGPIGEHHQTNFFVTVPEQRQDDDGAMVIVTQEHGGQGQPDSFRVEMVVDRPTTITRKYYRPVGGKTRILHEFMFENKTEEQVRNYELRIVPGRLRNVPDGQAIQFETGPLLVPLGVGFRSG